MRDPRNRTLAELLVEYSMELTSGDVLYLEVKGTGALDLAREVIDVTTIAGGIPLLVYHDEGVMRGFWERASEQSIRAYSEAHLDWMRRAQCFLSIRGAENPFDLQGIDQKQMDLMGKQFVGPVHMERRLNHTRWCAMRYPNNAMAVMAKKNQREFEDFFFKVCTLDYARLSKAMDPLAALMERTDKVHLEGPGTDLRFSIEGIPAVKCDGHRNIPDGEVYTAPVRDSVEGTITYNTGSIQQGMYFDGISLTFEKGRITGATCGTGDPDRLLQILRQDEGASYVGEFAFGLNPHITSAMGDILFDEKIGGSIHVTPGNAYKTADNGNRSELHWDLVLIQTPEHGGGTISFDGKVIRRDGRFVIDELSGCNPEALIS